MKKYFVATLMILTLAVGCALFQTNDPARVGLYTAKQTYMIGRESAIVACAGKVVSVDTCRKFRVADAAYTKRHNELVDLYLAAKPVASDTLTALQKLAEEVKSLAEQINSEGSVK